MSAAPLTRNERAFAAPLTKTEQVLDVLNAGGRTSHHDGIWELRDHNNNVVPAWNNAIKAASRIHKEASR